MAACDPTSSLRFLRPPGSWKHCKSSTDPLRPLVHAQTRLPGPRPPPRVCWWPSKRSDSPPRPSESRKLLIALSEAAMTAKKSGFFTTTPTMHANYNSQSAAGGPAVNPVWATVLASLVPFLVLKPNCCTYFQPSQSETNFGIFDKQLQLRYLDSFPYHINKLSFSEHYPWQSTFC